MLHIIKAVILTGLLATSVHTTTASAGELRSWIYRSDPGSTYSRNIMAAAANSAGQVALTSSTSYTSGTTLTLIDANGDESWTIPLSFSEFYSENPKTIGITIDGQGNIYVIAQGQLQSSPAISIKKYTANGHHQFSTIIQASDNNPEILPLGITAGEDGAVYALWYTSAFNGAADPKVYMGRININTGAPEWTQLIAEDETHMFISFFMIQIDEQQRPHLVFRYQRHEDPNTSWTMKHVVLDANGQDLPQITTMPRSPTEEDTIVNPIAAVVTPDNKLNIAYSVYRPARSHAPKKQSINLEQYDANGNWQWSREIAEAPQGGSILFPDDSRDGIDRYRGFRQIPRGKDGSMVFLYGLEKFEPFWIKQMSDLILVRVDENGFHMKAGSITRPVYDTPLWSGLGIYFGLFSSNYASDSVYVAAHNYFNVNDSYQNLGFVSHLLDPR